METTTITKKCTKCGLVKPLSEFHKDKRIKDGHRADCKACHNAARPKKRQTEKSREPTQLERIEERLEVLENELTMYRERYGVFNDDGFNYRPIDGIDREIVFEMFIDELDRVRKQFGELAYMDTEFLAFADTYGTEYNFKWSAFKKFYNDLNAFYKNRLVIEQDGTY